MPWHPSLAVCVNDSNAAASTTHQPSSHPALVVFLSGLTLSDFCRKDHLLLRQQAQDTVHFTARERDLWIFAGESEPR